MKNTIVTGSLIVFSDGFVWKRLSNEKAYKIWVSAENEDFELYKVRVDDESESLIAGKIIDYFDGSFAHAICGDCENEVIISDIEEVKHEIDLRFHEFIERTGREPEYVECQIVWKGTGDDKRTTIKLSLSINDDDNDDVFYYCNGIESFKQLAEYGMGEFIVTYCWSFF